MRTMLCALALLLSQCAPAQDCTAYVVANVFDAKTGKRINELQPQNFEARAGKTLLKVAAADPLENNRILVLMDASGSAEEPRVAETVKTVADISREGPEGLPIAFGVFGEKRLFTSGFIAGTNDRDQEISRVMAELQTSSIGKYPKLFDALDEALTFFQQRRPGDTILLVSRGFDFESTHSLKEISRRFSETGVRLLVVTGERTTPQDRNLPDWLPKQQLSASSWEASPATFRLLKLAKHTGGAFIAVVSSSWFELATRGYLLAIVAPADLKRPADLTLHISKSTEKAYGKMRALYPEQLSSCISSGAATH